MNTRSEVVNYGFKYVVFVGEIFPHESWLVSLAMLISDMKVKSSKKRPTWKYATSQSVKLLCAFWMSQVFLSPAGTILTYDD